MLARRLTHALAFAAVCALALPATAQDRDTTIEVEAGGFKLVKLNGQFNVANTEIAVVADVPGGLMIKGKAVGETQLVVISGRRARTYRIKVGMPVSALASEIAQAFPREAVEVRGIGGAIMLSGTVNSTEAVESVVEFVQAYVNVNGFRRMGSQGKVINNLAVRARQQVMLEVKFAEVRRESIREWSANAVGGKSDKQFGFVTGSGAITNSDIGTNPTGVWSDFTAPQSGFVTGSSVTNNLPAGALLFTNGGDYPFAAALSLLQGHRLAKSLAEPTLVAQSGSTAAFLAGGEIPIEKGAALGNTSIEYKDFGVKLDFSPLVLSDDTVQLKLMAEVSAPDASLGVRTSGNFINIGFRTRRAETVVRLRDGQSFAIAGLINEELQNNIDKFPGLGDLPILGKLFSSASFRKQESELMVVVTVHLVDPMDEREMPPLPGQDRVNDPNDWELWFGHWLDPDTPKSSMAADGGRDFGTMNNRQPSGRLGFWR